MKTPQALISLALAAALTGLVAPATATEPILPTPTLRTDDLCPPSVTTSGSYDWKWVFGVAEYPADGSYYKAYYDKTTNYGLGDNGVCYATSWTCVLTVEDGLYLLGSSSTGAAQAGGGSYVHIQWVRGGETTVNGHFRGIPFSGTQGACNGDDGHAHGWFGLVVAVRGNGST